VRPGRALLLAPLLLVLAGSLYFFPSSLGADTLAPAAPRHGIAILLIVDQVSFEQEMSVPEFRALARAGGTGLMTTRVGSGQRQAAAYLTIGSGAVASDGVRRLVLADDLMRGGVQVCVAIPAAGSPGGPIFGLGTGRNSPVCGGPASGPLTSFAPADREVASLAGSNRDGLVIVDASGPLPGGFAPASITPRPLSPAERLSIAAEVARRTLAAAGTDRVLVVAVTPQPSPDMDRRGDEVTALVMAEGPAGELLSEPGRLRALASDSTRQAGLVSNVDVAPTILNFFGLPIPAEMDGRPIRATDDPAPFALHRLELEHRRIRLPVQLGEVAFVAAAGILSLIALWMRQRVSPRVASAARFMALCGAALLIPLYAGGLLPRLTYWVVVPFIVLSVVGLAIAALAVRWPGPLGPLTFLGAVGLALVVVDSLFGGRAGRIPLFGATMFDGVRFYGLPNAFIALVLASSLFVAARLKPFPGFALLVAAGLYAGLPSLGANLGAAATLFAAAGLWWVLRTHARFGWPELAVAAGIMLGGTVAVLVLNRLLPGAPTHIARFAEGMGSSGGFFDTAHHRLSVAFAQVSGNIAAFIPLFGLPVLLAVSAARPGVVGRGLALEPSWRAVLITLTAASIVAFFVNDTGVSAAGPGFLYAMSALVYPIFLAASDAPLATGESSSRALAPVGGSAEVDQAPNGP
jgi:hypothetical protein